MMKFIHRKFGARAEFLIGDHFVNYHQIAPKVTDTTKPGYATQVGDRWIVKMGTLIRQTPTGKEKEDEKPAALGFAFNDYDVTDGDAMMAVCVHGVVQESALPATVATADKAALKGIIFV